MTLDGNSPPRSDIEVSLIIANYNGAQFIGDALESALKQTLTNIEIIVSDDASTDSSVDIVRRVALNDDRVHLVQSNNNRGPAAARNSAIAIARGRWIGILDSDDLMHPDRLRRLVEEGDTSGADLVADDLLLFDNDHLQRAFALLTGKWARKAQWLSSADYLATNNLYGTGPTTGYLKPLFRSATIEKHSCRYNEGLRIAEDYDFVFRLLLAGARLRTIPDISYFYRRHSSSISHRLSVPVLEALLEVERDTAARWSSGALKPLFVARETSILRAIAFEKLVQAIKGRRWSEAAAVAAATPSATWLLRLPLAQFARRPWPRRKPKVDRRRRQLCIVTRQRITGRTNGSSRYLLDIAEFLARQDLDVHLLVPSPATLGRWPYLKLSKDLDVFRTIRFRGTVRVGEYLVAVDPRIALKGVVALLDRILYRKGLIRRPLSRPAPYAIAQASTRQDQLFIAREAPLIADVLIADYCFLTETYPFALRPDAGRMVIMHDLFSSRSSQFATLDATDSVASLTQEEELRMLGRAETIVAIQRDEAAVVQRGLPRCKVVVAPVAALAVGEPQIGEADIVVFVGSSAAPNVDGLGWFMSECWPRIREARPKAVLQIAGSVCHAVKDEPAGARLLDVVPDLDRLYTQASVVVSPLRAGSGLKIKLIEALSKGKAMVVTSATMQGVMDMLGDCVVVDDSAAGFSSAVVDLLGDPERRRKLGAKGIQAIARHFAPDSAYGGIAAAATAALPGRPIP